MPKILGMEPKTAYWVFGGLAAVVVAYWFLVVRPRQAAGAMVSAAPDQFGAGATGGSAPVSQPGATDQYAEQLAGLQVQAAQEQLKEQQQLFGVQLGQIQQQATLAGQYATQILPSQVGLAQAAIGEQAAEYQTATAQQGALQKQVAKTGATCPGSASLRWNPQQGWYCREKTSGGLLGRISRIVGNALGGVQAGIGQATETATIAAGQATAVGVRQVIPGMIGGAIPTSPRVVPYAGSPLPAGGGGITYA